MVEVLRVTTSDYKLTVITNEIFPVYRRAALKNLDIEISTKYNVRNCESCMIELFDYDIDILNTDQLNEINSNDSCPPVFFENKDYIFDIEFTEKPDSGPEIYSPLREIKDKFITRRDKKLTTGLINFGNDIGKVSLCLSYSKNGKTFQHELEFEVFPVKLDYKNDYNTVLTEIDDEFENIVLDIFRKTFSEFSEVNRETHLIFWWSLFQKIFEVYLRSANLILNRPHNRLVSEVYYSKADRIKQLTPKLEEEIAENRISKPNRFYRVEKKTLTLDTTENRFFKFLANDVYRKFDIVSKQILTKYSDRVTDDLKSELNDCGDELRRITLNPFFRTVGEFRGLKQESLVLQKKTGYSTLFRIWIMLKKGLEYKEGVNRIELKGIDYLYQIWCFIVIKKIISDITEIEPSEYYFPVKLDGLTVSPDTTGMRAKFIRNNGELIELIHEPKYLRSTKNGDKTFTVNQIPDIVLRITKDDLYEGYSFTYVFDAKYRLMSEDEKNHKYLKELIEYPPDDAINQMHRYRDAIFYNEYDESKPKKEVIGAYILYPGQNSREEIKDEYFNTAILKVNIGAFQIYPNGKMLDPETTLFEHLKKILEQSSGEAMVKDVIAQKGMEYEIPDGKVIIALVEKNEHKIHIKSVNPEYSYLHITEKNNLVEMNDVSSIRYYAPYIKGEGVLGYFRCKNISIVERKNVEVEGRPLHKPGKEPCYRFELNGKMLPLPVKIEEVELLRKAYTLCNLSELRAGKIESGY